MNVAAGVALKKPPSAALSVLMCWLPSVASNEKESEATLRSAIKAMLKTLFEDNRGVRIIVGDERTVLVALAEEELRQIGDDGGVESSR